MAKFLVCLDGTKQKKIQENPTNIAKLFDAVGGRGVDAGSGSFESSNAGVYGKYLPGVGSRNSDTLLVLGNLFGDGVAELIVRSYTYLSRSCRAGDEIYICGFSRGATAARALAGLIAAQGLLDSARYDTANKNEAYLRAIAAWYRHREGQPILANGVQLTLLTTLMGRNMPTLQAQDFLAVERIEAVAAFDTVSSLGVPVVNDQGVATFDFSICDTRLHDKVKYGFHALAADETRDLFAPTYWEPRQKVEQVIFPGTHSNIGGGFDQFGLSDGVLDWMLERLATAGLSLNRNAAGRIEPDALDLMHDDARLPPFLGRHCRPRRFPISATVHASLRARFGKTTIIFPGFPAAYHPAGVYSTNAPLLT